MYTPRFLFGLRTVPLRAQLGQHLFAWSTRTISQTSRTPCLSKAAQVRPSWRSMTRPHVQSQQRHASGFRQPFNYQRFNQSRSTIYQLSQHPHFYYYVAGAGLVIGGFYTFNLEEVPVSHRRRFNIISDDYEAALGQTMYQQTMQEYGRAILPLNHPSQRLAERVAKRLIPHSGLPDQAWEVHVIDSPETNAFVGPGGKIFVFSGILPICKDEAGLAVVLSHEIAHNVAHHLAERMSENIVWLPVIFLAQLAGIDMSIGRLAVDLAFSKPASRTQESEADYIGLLMMSEACYDPRAAVGLWKRMHELGNATPPQWLSTHPTEYNRMEMIKTWLPEAEDKLQQSGCQLASENAADFWSQALTSR